MSFSQVIDVKTVCINLRVEKFSALYFLYLLIEARTSEN